MRGTYGVTVGARMMLQLKMFFFSMMMDVLGEIRSNKYHSALESMSYCKITRASSWLAYTLKPDLSNLKTILKIIEQSKN